MITVIVPAHDSADALAGLLAALVPAAVDGLVREVIVADGDADPATSALCEDAGATLLRGSIAAAAAVAKGNWLLIVTPEMRFPSRWIEIVADHSSRATKAALLLPPLQTGWFAGRRQNRSAGLLIRTRDFGGTQGDLRLLVDRFGRGAVRLG
ncbi:cell wall biosynthesis glycosyltransferase [Phenylobacterium sp.]|uniref:cell wall biosynthesis glycosyltransferase n=1 Tax=Phenylobacterium sp. TaxID=1871053 RepID=UPI00272F5F81|nr:cell wall biosynthesis glycosyltransferase [Phenylobacterium sp.]MDP1875720.1 cell wall biosynthesis glycosyltransferase [Phenylobacterium sp.]MDP3491456.1 cell wall biosynthesis glycosyltransferase [Phenylobacterium sp.]